MQRSLTYTSTMQSIFSICSKLDCLTTIIFKERNGFLPQVVLHYIAGRRFYLQKIISFFVIRQSNFDPRAKILGLVDVSTTSNKTYASLIRICRFHLNYVLHMALFAQIANTLFKQYLRKLKFKYFEKKSRQDLLFYYSNRPSSSRDITR